MKSDSPNATAESTLAGGHFATFFVAGLFLGVDIACVQEVLAFQPITAVPRAPEVVKGLINLRGQIATAMDLRRRLGLPPRSTEETPMNVVVQTSHDVASLLVDDIGDVLTPDAGTCEPAPANLEPAIRNLVRAVYKLPARLLLILDVPRTVDLGVINIASTDKEKEQHSVPEQ